MAREKPLGGLILSGGPDSALAAWKAVKKFDVDSWRAYFFHYGQLATPEAFCAGYQAGKLGIPIFPIIIPAALLTSTMTARSEHRAADNIEPTFVPGRNDIFISMVAARLYHRGGALLIVGGWNEEDSSGYPDCRAAYLTAKKYSLEKALDCPVEIEAPVITYKKETIISEACEVGIPLDHTWSCYTPEFVEPNQFHPCRKCVSCKLREKGFTRAGVEDPLSYIAMRRTDG